MASCVTTVSPSSSACATSIRSNGSRCLGGSECTRRACTNVTASSSKPTSRLVRAISSTSADSLPSAASIAIPRARRADEHAIGPGDHEGVQIGHLEATAEHCRLSIAQVREIAAPNEIAAGARSHDETSRKAPCLRVVTPKMANLHAFVVTRPLCCGRSACEKPKSGDVTLVGEPVGQRRGPLPQRPHQ
jgi:hypothetical protein